MNYKTYKYSIGDSVKILEDFDKHRYVTDAGIDPEMCEYRG